MAVKSAGPGKSETVQRPAGINGPFSGHVAQQMTGFIMI
jgi:hypothetical protein